MLTSYVTRVVPGEFFKDSYDCTKISYLRFGFTLVYVLFKAIYEIGESMLWEVCTLILFVMVWL